MIKIDKIKNFKQFLNEDLENIKQKYSIENIERLWDMFSLRTRGRIESGLHSTNIDINKLFVNQSVDGQNEIVQKFNHAGPDIYIDWEKNWK